MKDDNVAKVSVNSAFLFSARLIDMVAVMLNNVIIARHLGATSFGEYSFILAYVVSVTMIAYFGLDALTVRDIAKHADDEAARYLGAIVVARWLMSGLAALLVAAGLPFMEIERKFLLALALITASELSNAWVSVQTSVFRAREKMRYEVYITLFWRVTSLAAISLAAHLDLDMTAICGVMLLTNLLRAALTLWIANTRFLRPDFSEVRQLLTGIFKDAATMGAAILVTNWLFRSAQMAIKLVLGPEPVAFFQVSHAMILQVSTVAVSVALALFPMISRKALRDRKNMESVAEIYEGAAKLLMCLGLAFSTALIFVSQPLILLLFGREYAGAVAIFQVLLVALVPIFVYSLHVFMFAAYNKQRFVIVSRGCCLLLAIGLYLLLIPRLGALGAACAYVIASAGIGLMEGVLLQRRVVVHIKSPLGCYFLNLTLAAGLSASFVLGYSWPVRLSLLFLIMIMVALQLKGLYAIVKARRAKVAARAQGGVS